MEETTKYLKALVALIAQNYNVEGSPKIEILLSRAGLSHGEIADITGKTTAAIAKAISRGRLR